VGATYDFIPDVNWVDWVPPTFYRRVKTAIKIGLAIVPTVRKIKASGCDIVYSNSSTICSGAIAAGILGLPHVWHLHEFPSPYGMRFCFGEAFSFRVIRALSAVCIAVSRHLSSICEPYVGEQMRVIYPSMNMAQRKAPAEKTADGVYGSRARLRCVIVGGLVEGKGQEDAVRAVTQLHHSGTNADLLVVGEGNSEYRKRLESLVAVGGVQGKVHFVGAVEDATSIIRASDVVLVCSKYEAFGRVSIEGMLAGKPVIGAEAAATSELIRAGVNGWLYRSGDATDLASKIQRLYDDPGLAKSVAENGRTWANGIFNKQRYGAELMEALTPLAAHRN
jgi:glycosyltransferase involved in cell wall biosynthesis